MYRVEEDQKFGRWTVTGPGLSKSYCVCECGEEKVVKNKNLVKGLSMSCGCLANELAVERSTTHGHSHHSQKRGGKQSPTYRSWRGMIDRCVYPSNASYKRYGGRGIKVCDRWRKFENFLEDMGEKPSPEHDIDRKDSNKNYEKSNCRWLHRSKNRNHSWHG